MSSESTKFLLDPVSASSSNVCTRGGPSGFVVQEDNIILLNCGGTVERFVKETVLCWVLQPMGCTFPCVHMFLLCGHFHLLEPLSLGRKCWQSGLPFSFARDAF